MSGIGAGCIERRTSYALKFGALDGCRSDAAECRRYNQIVIGRHIVDVPNLGLDRRVIDASGLEIAVSGTVRNGGNRAGSADRDGNVDRASSRDRKRWSTYRCRIAGGAKSVVPQRIATVVANNEVISRARSGAAVRIHSIHSDWKCSALGGSAT
jgi:hypothetical protein